MKSARRFVLIALIFAGVLRAEAHGRYAKLLPMLFTHDEQIAIPDIERGRLDEARYKEKIKDLAKLAASVKPDVIGLEEIGSDLEATDLPEAIKGEWPGGGDWEVCFVEGKDHQTGEDVATLVRKNAAKVKGFSREKGLAHLSKLLVTRLEADGKLYFFLTVHLVRPIGNQKPHHEQQLGELRKWVGDTKSSGSVVVVGDFNNTKHKLLPLEEATDFTGHAATHMNKSEYDHVFAPKVKSAKVTQPMYGAAPNAEEIKLWTDHFMLSAVID